MSLVHHPPPQPAALREALDPWIGKHRRVLYPLLHNRAGRADGLLDQQNTCLSADVMPFSKILPAGTSPSIAVTLESVGSCLRCDDNDVPSRAPGSNTSPRDEACWKLSPDTAPHLGWPVCDCLPVAQYWTHRPSAQQLSTMRC